MDIRTLTNLTEYQSNIYAKGVISILFNIFGDDVASKLYWPFSEKTELSWSNYINTDSTKKIEDAQLLMNLCKKKYEKELNDMSNKETYKISKLASLIERIDKRIEKSINISEAINQTSEDTNESINNIINQ